MARASEIRGNRSASLSDDEEDLTLLRQIGAGDRDSFRRLYTKYYGRLLGFIYRLTGRRELAEEGVNDVMFVVWSSGRSFAGNSKVSTWIMGIAYRKGLKLAEKSRRWYTRFASVDGDAWNEPSAEAGVHTFDADLREELEHGIRQLPPKQRAVLELTYYYGYSYEEIATIADCPVNTVKTRMFHARAKLKSLLPSFGGRENDTDS
jgi:RNA polymerase sigma-70 factor (ECF subfamily)